MGVSGCSVEGADRLELAYPTLVLAFVKFIVEIVLLIVTVLLAVKVVGWFTKGDVDEWKEIRKGNVAVQSSLLDDLSRSRFTL